MIVVITPTGERPEAFAQCARYMAAQTYDQNWTSFHIRPLPYWQPGQNTQARNLLVALQAVKPGDRVVIVEDDDAYEPWWLATCYSRLDDHEMVGECNSLYVNQNTGARREMKNMGHASLCSTAFKGLAVDWLKDVCKVRTTAIDVNFWKTGEKMGGAQLYQPVPRGVVGVKGWPGRPGIGVGHRI